VSLVTTPRTLPELWDALDAWPEARLLAGGTDLLVWRRNGKVQAERLICLDRLDELRGVRELDGWIELGAAATHAELLAEPLITERLPVLAQALRVLGSPLVRNAGTLGGNVCTASPAGDSLPPLYALDAEVELQSRNSGRRMPVADFILGPGKTALARGEVLRAVWAPLPAPGTLQHYEKVGKRQAMSLAVVSLAALIERDEAGLVTRARLAWGAAGPTVLRLPDVERVLLGGHLNAESLGDAALLARAGLRPIDDARASAAYRRQVGGNLLLRLVGA
jgi:CO/xanthine dehydrogenase FAD-binding subunit